MHQMDKPDLFSLRPAYGNPLPLALQIPARQWHKRATTSEGTPLYGLEPEQKRKTPQRLPRASWYNAYGQNVGRGDLDREDIERLQAELPEHAYFLAARKAQRLPSETHPPGFTRTLARSELLITRGRAWWILFTPRTPTVSVRGILLPTLPFNVARQLLSAVQPLETAPAKAPSEVMPS